MRELFPIKYCGQRPGVSPWSLYARLRLQPGFTPSAPNLSGRNDVSDPTVLLADDGNERLHDGDPACSFFATQSARNRAAWAIQSSVPQSTEPEWASYPDVRGGTPLLQGYAATGWCGTTSSDLPFSATK